MVCIFMLVISLVACGNDIQNEGNIGESPRQVQKDDQHTKVVTTKVENVEAIYIGQNDNNTVKVIVDGKLNTFLLQEHKDTELKTFVKDDKVKISYTIKTEQVKDGEIKTSYLTKIEKVSD